MNSGSGILQRSARDVLYVAFRHKWTLVVCLVLVAGSITLVTYLVPDIYRSEAKLLIRLGRENLSVDPSVSGPTVNPISSHEREVNSELAILTSRSIAEQVVTTLGEDVILEKDPEPSTEGPWMRVVLRRVKTDAKDFAKWVPHALRLLPDLPSREKAVKKITDELKVSIEKETNVINARYEAKDPQRAQAILETLIKFYLEQHIQAYASQASPRFFEAQAAKLEEDLVQRERRLEEFRAQYGITAMDRQKEVLLQQISGLESKVNEVAAQRSATEARVATLEKTLHGKNAVRELSRVSGRANAAADTLKDKLVDLRLKETEMAARYSATHRPLIDLRDQIKQAEATLAKEQETLTEITTGVDTNYQQLQLSLDNESAQLKASQAQQEVLATELTRQKAAMNELTSRELALTALERDVELADKEYKQYRDNVQRSRISSAMDLDKVSNVSVVQPASLPLDPVKPKKPLNIAVGLFLGLFIGVGLVFVLEYLDDSLKTVEDVEARLGVPVLAVISEKEFKACT